MSLANRTSAAMNELSVHAGTFEDIVSGCCYMTKQGLKVTLHEILGEGGFGKVFLGRSNGCDFAVKAVRYTSEYGREKIKNEIAYLACLSSSGFTPQFHGYTHLKDCYVLEMERMGLSLDAWTKLQIHGVPHSDIKSIGHQILQGVNYIHSMGIIHSDLKPENLCLVHGDRLIVKTGPQLSQMAIGDLFGTMPYALPEMLLGLQLTSKLDIWSIGLILAETMTGARVFTETNRDNMIRAMHQTRLIQFAGLNSPYFTSSLEVYGPEAPPLVYTDLQALIVKYTVGYGWTNDKKQKFVSFLMKLLTPDSWLRPSSEEGLQGYPD